MQLPLENRIIGKAKVPNFAKDPKTEAHANQVRYMLEQKLSIGLGSEFLKRVGVDRLGAVGNEFEIEYVMEVYDFTKDELIKFMQEVERSVQLKYLK